MPPKKRSRRASAATPSKRSQRSSGWTIRVLDVALAQIEALPKDQREHILNFLFGRLRQLADPKSHGEALVDEFAGFWRYRINDYRIICTIEDEKRLVRVVKVGHRYDVYRDRG